MEQAIFEQCLVVLHVYPEHVGRPSIRLGTMYFTDTYLAFSHVCK